MTGKITTAEKLLEGHFLQPTYDQFWHHLMKVKKTDETYQNDKVELRVSQIIKKNGVNSFTSIGDKGWTPSHVAVLSNNEAGLKFLKERGALAANIKDAQGNTPLALAKQLHPALLKFFTPSVDLSRIDNLFVSLPQKPALYVSNTDDFGVEIKRILFKKTIDEALVTDLRIKTEHLTKNMLFYGKKFGFEIVFSQNGYFPRDNFIRLPNGDVRTMVQSENVEVGLDRSLSKELHYRSKASFQTDHLFFKVALGSAYKNMDQALVDMSALYGQTPTLRFYLEGGTYYYMSGLDHPCLLITEDIFTVAFNQMRRDQVFKDSNINLGPAVTFFTQQLSENSVFLNETLEEMYSQGLLSKGKGKEKGFLTPDEIKKVIFGYEGEVRNSGAYSIYGNPYLQHASKLGLYCALDLNSIQKKNGIPIAAEYLAQKEIAKVIIARSFSVTPKELFLVSSLDYHLDMFVRPGPNCIFVQDYSLSLSLLKEIEKQKEELCLTPLDLKMLKRYLDTAEKLHRELGSLNEKVKTQLSATGLPVVPLPALFYDVSPDKLNLLEKTFNVSFLNAITGWSSKTKSYYYLTSGASAGDSLGRILMESFETILKHYQPGIEVGFTGFDPENKSNFSEAMICLNQMGAQFGPHCAAFVLETVTHRDTLDIKFE